MIVVPDDAPSVLTGTAAELRLQSLGDTVIHTAAGAEQAAELTRRIANARVVLTLRAYSTFSDDVVRACPGLRMISVWGTGTDNIDLDACARRGIVVTTTAGANARAVAEHTMALMLGITHRVAALDAALRRGEWRGGLLTQLEGKTLGVIGLGMIGTRVAALASAFGMRVLAWTRELNADREMPAGVATVSLDALLRESDVVTLHLALNAETRGFLGRDQLRALKPGAYLVNTARAGLVERDALLDALRHGPLAGAALDVFHHEPLPAGDPLLGMPNVLLTPHIAGATPESISAGLDRAVDNVQRFLATHVG